MADFYHTSFSFLGSLVTTTLVGLLILATTLRFENFFSDISYFGFLGIFGVFFIYSGTRTIRNYRLDLKKIDALFTKVENGETLLPIAELMEIKREQP